MKAHEQIGLVVVGKRRAFVQTDGGIGIASQDHPESQSPLEGRFQPSSDTERDLFLQRPRWSACAVLRSAMSRVNDNGAERAGGSEIDQRWTFRRRRRRL